jgi:hypothetical protein
VGILQAQGAHGFGGTASVTLSSPLSGAGLICAVDNSSGSVGTVSDTSGLTWTQLATGTAYGGGGDVEIWFAPIVTGGATPTVSASGSFFAWNMIVTERDDVAATQPVAIGADTSSGSGTVTDGTTGSATGVGNIGYAYWAYGSGSPSAPSGFTINVDTGHSVDEFQNATVDNTTFTPSITWASGTFWGVVAVVLAPGGGGGGGGGSVSGQGSVSCSSPTAVEITMTGIPTFLPQSLGNPDRRWGLGNVAWAKGGFSARNYYLEHASERVEAPFAADTLYYSFAVGISATLTFV